MPDAPRNQKVDMLAEIGIENTDQRHNVAKTVQLVLPQNNLRCFHPPQSCTEKLAVSINEAEPYPFDGIDSRHFADRRWPSPVTITATISID